MALPVAVCWAGLGWFNPEALDLLLSSGPPPLRCTRPAGYGSSICLKADKSPRSPVKTSHTNLEPSHILALLHNLLLLSPAPPSSPRVSPSSLVSAYHQKYFDSSSSSCCSSIKSPGTCITVQQVLQVPVPRARERERERKEERTERGLQLIAYCLSSIEFDAVQSGICNLPPPKSYSYAHAPREILRVANGCFVRPHLNVTYLSDCIQRTTGAPTPLQIHHHLKRPTRGPAKKKEAPRLFPSRTRYLFMQQSEV